MMKSEIQWSAELLESMDKAVAVIDARDTVVYANRVARELFAARGSDLKAAAVAADIRSAKQPRNNVIFEAPGTDAPWRGQAWPLASDAVALVLRPPATGKARVDAVCATLGLEVQEARLAIHASEGHSNRSIAQMYNLPVGTIATRMWRLYRKLGVRNRAELAALVATCPGADEASPS